jgi:hypothetical protein
LRNFSIAVNSSLRLRQGYAKSKAMPTPAPRQNPTDPPTPTSADGTSERPVDRRPLSEAAARALTEAAARRSERGNAERSQAANEIGGRSGLDPTRYGDWEVNGLASDF